MFSFGLIMAQQCPAQITISSSAISITGDDGDNQVEITQLGYGFYEVALRRGNGTWQTRRVGNNRPDFRISCNLHGGSNYFSNRTALNASIFVSGDEYNTIVCGDGDDFYFSTGNSRDLVFGGDGNDYLNPGENRDLVYGEEGEDEIFDSTIWNYVNISGYVAGSDGDVDWLYGGDDNDMIYSGTEDRVTE